MSHASKAYHYSRITHEAGKLMNVTFALNNEANEFVSVQVQQQNANSEWETLASTTVAHEAEVNLDFTPSNTSALKLLIKGVDLNIRVGGIRFKRVDLFGTTVVSTICNTGDFENDYRFGYNGMHKDNEIKGIGNSLDFGARIYDSRLGRWLSLDPLQAKYPSMSAYNFVGNSPVSAIDPNGNNIYIVTGKNQSGNTKLQQENYLSILNLLNSTKKGKELIESYIDNPNADVYITLDKIPEFGKTFSSSNLTKNSNDQPHLENDKLTGIEKHHSSFKNFEGMEVIKPTNQNHFMTVNNDRLDDDLTGNYDSERFVKKKDAKVTAHEFGHVKYGLFVPNQDQDIVHNIWGQDHYGGKESKEAEEVNTQIQKLKGRDVKDELKFVPTDKKDIQQLKKK